MTFKRTLDVDSPSKICPGCKIEKIKEEGFWKNKASRDGFSYKCKICSKEQTEKWRDSEVGKAKTRATGIEWRINNPEKIKQNKKNYRENNPETSRKSVQKCWNNNKDKYKVTHWRTWLRNKYGLTEGRYYEILEDQNYCCAICGSPEKDSRRQRFCVDHCHDTGIVRGLLCFSCNVLLGNANDSIGLLEEAITYLKKFPKPELKIEEDEWLKEVENQ